MDEAIYRLLADRLEAGLPGVLATVVHTRGSTPQRAGAKAIFTPEGGVIGTIGGGCLEADAQRRALEVLAGGGAELLTIQLNHEYDQDSGLICGGTARIWVEPTAPELRPLLDALATARAAGVAAAFATVVEGGAGHLVVREDGPVAGDESLAAPVREALRQRSGGLLEAGDQTLYVDLVVPRPRLWIAGAGHVGRAVARFARDCDFEVTVIDERPDLCSPANIPWAEHHHATEIATDLSARDYGPEDYVVIVTRGHRHDADALRAVIGSDAKYLGLIGSRRKIKLISDGLLEDGAATPEQLARVYAPIGLDIGAVSVDEIALCIVAELVAVRRGRLTSPGDRLSREKRKPSGAGCMGV